ncbi:hypothetical protein KCU81_g376, partial [Aureobasidium melanogenum]|uniref:Uncharacterized protein n=1 Tax=Aureobasidium melanogenum (strain CBS 110374) TaxID=1043003 RepID=A0A074W323_AURM1
MSRTYDQPFRGLPRELRDMVWRELLVLDRVTFRKPERSEKPDGEPVGADSLLSPLTGMTDLRGDPLHLNLFLTNKQVFAETSPIFYSSNEFIMHSLCTQCAEQCNNHVRPAVRRVRLETRSRPVLVQPQPHDIHVPWIGQHHRLDLVTVRMPYEPPAVPAHVNRAINLPYAVYLVACMLKGSIKRLRLLYPIPTGFLSPEDFWTIQLLRKGKRLLSDRDQVSKIRKVWNKADMRGYIEILNKLRDAPLANFVARFEDGSSFRVPRGNAAIVLSRIEDEPIEKDTVPRPKVRIVGPNSHLKRKFPWNPDVADPRPNKFSRLQFPAFLVFSESRSRKMPQSAVQERFKGKSNQIRRLVSEGRASFGSATSGNFSMAATSKT